MIQHPREKLRKGKIAHLRSLFLADAVMLPIVCFTTAYVEDVIVDSVRTSYNCSLAVEVDRARKEVDHDLRRDPAFGSM